MENHESREKYEKYLIYFFLYGINRQHIISNNLIGQKVAFSRVLV